MTSTESDLSGWSPWLLSDALKTDSQLRILRDFLASCDLPSVRLFRRLFNDDRSGALLESVLDELTAFELMKLYRMVSDNTAEPNQFEVPITGLVKRRMRQQGLLERPADALLRRADAELSALVDVSRFSIPEPFTSENLYRRLACNLEFHQFAYVACILLWSFAVLVSFPAYCAPFVVTVITLFTFRASLQGMLDGNHSQIALSLFNASVFLFGVYLTGILPVLYFVLGLASLGSAITLHAIFMGPKTTGT